MIDEKIVQVKWLKYVCYWLKGKQIIDVIIEWTLYKFWNDSLKQKSERPMNLNLFYQSFKFFACEHLIEFFQID